MRISYYIKRKIKIKNKYEINIMKKEKRKKMKYSKTERYIRSREEIKGLEKRGWGGAVH